MRDGIKEEKIMWFQKGIIVTEDKQIDCWADTSGYFIYPGIFLDYFSDVPKYNILEMSDIPEIEEENKKELIESFKKLFMEDDVLQEEEAEEDFTCA